MSSPIRPSLARHHAVVVGAGIVGASTAWELRRRGWEVTVVDPAPGQGASRAAAGMLAPVAEVVWDQPTLYPLMVRAAREYPDFVEGVSRAVGHPVGYLRTETLVCAGDAADRQYLEELAGLQTSMGLDVEPLTATQARRLEPALAPTFSGAMRIRQDHQVDPRRLVPALLEGLFDGPGPAARLERVEASSLVWRDGAVVGVRLADGREVAADQTVVATGVRCELLDTEALPALPVRPVWGDVLRVHVPRHLQPLLVRTVRGIVRGFPVYLVPREDGSLVVGATSREDGGEGVAIGGIHQLLRDGSRLLPGLLECQLDEAMSRARPGSPDDVPMIGRLAEGLVVSTGFFRHGILLGPLGGRLTADVVCGTPLDEETASAVDPLRFA